MNVNRAAHVLTGRLLAVQSGRTRESRRDRFTGGEGLSRVIGRSCRAAWKRRRRGACPAVESEMTGARLGGVFPSFS
jgi:hypothetical protein